MSSPSYDLTTQPWIQVRGSAETEHVGLRELFLRAHELDDVLVSLPPAGAGLWRLLVVMAARITGLDRQDGGVDGVEDWEDARETVMSAGRFDPGAVKRYFDEHADRMDLFGDRPWLQESALAEQCRDSSGLNKLVLVRPAGQNQVWFDHHHAGQADPVSVPEAIGYLLTALYYGPSGRCTARTVSGRTEANTTAGPLRRTVSFHPLGRSVFESLVTGIPFMGAMDGVDAAPWEVTEARHALGIPPVPAGVGGVLAGRFRHAVLLKPNEDGTAVTDAWLTWAWRQPHGEARDPYLIYQYGKDGSPYERGADADRALWRDLDALLNQGTGTGQGDYRRPAVFDGLAFVPQEVREGLRVRAFGFDQDGQTRDRHWFTAITPPVLGLLDTESATYVARMRATAEQVHSYMRWALRKAWVAINDPSNGDREPARRELRNAGYDKVPWFAKASASYWPRAEQEFWRRVHARAFDGYDRDFVHAGLTAFDEVTDAAGARPRAKRAIENARGLIYRAAVSSRRKE